ncbi:NAD(P)/FAD-dependent oxidoreductase [Bacillus sp. B1-b2]|uniref:NAD(P)/FAD-dependent oxidoreductase n=1 Tax=Bacillus sp. B1-b2 TaxID=2653201 RepID=UPI0012620A95|nr:FAD-dependent oxidoreductase [Bacillus sp. B1-b2]KAB7669388.1 FAD-binding oxidoreductase [Bacillus sp. B1-b2]
MKKVIIIGGGILGASTAYELSKKGVEVVVIDREDIGQATKAAAGIICPWNSQRRNKRWYVLAKEGAKYYPDLVEQLSGYHDLDIGYKKVGALCLHSDENKLEQMRERTLKRKLDAPEIGDISILTSNEARELFPILTNDFHALHISGAARVDGFAMRNALLEASIVLGARYYQSNARILWDKGRITGVQLQNQTSIYADEVIITAGVWANELLEPLQLNFDVNAQKGQIMHISIPKSNCNEWPVVMPPHDQYLLTLNNRIVIGATHENISDLNPDITLAGMKEIMDKAFFYAPELMNSKLEEMRIGYRPFTADFLPIFGKVNQYEGLSIANGLGASGLTMGPFIGKQLANWMTGNNITIDLEDYSINSSIKEL